MLEGQYFLCCDNGIMSMLTNEIKPEKIVEITISEAEEEGYAVLGTFIKVACHIARGGMLEVIGKRVEGIKQIIEIQPFVNADQNQIVGSVIYIDNFGNVISNISKAIFQQVGKGRDYEIIARNHTFTKVLKSYVDVVDFSIPVDKRQDDGKRLALFNSADFLEISIYKSNRKTVGGASSLLGLDYRDTITVKFNS